jgi:hypothetical protein
MNTASETIDTYTKVATAGECLDGLDLTTAPDTTMSAPLKIAHVSDVHGESVKLPQFRENAVDIDVATNIRLRGEFGTLGVAPAGGQVITVKGGSHAIDLGGTILSDPGRQGAHIQVGQWMDQTYAMTSGVSLDFIHPDALPVYVVTGWVVPFSVRLHGACRWLFVESMKLKAYIIFKFVVRLILRIPKGVKGPSWL